MGCITPERGRCRGHHAVNTIMDDLGAAVWLESWLGMMPVMFLFSAGSWGPLLLQKILGFLGWLGLERQAECGCRSLGCLEPGCQLCAQNPHRRCEGNFANKYLAGDVLKAKCGASIRLEVIDRRTGDPLKAGDLEGIQLEVPPPSP